MLRCTLIALCLAASGCSYDYTPPDTSGGYSSERLVSIFSRECLDERQSLARVLAESTRGSSCFGDRDCERDARGHYVWVPQDAPELEVSMMSDAWMLSEERGDGWHCEVRFWRRPDDLTVDRLSELAADEGLTRYETWERSEDRGRIAWHVWRPADGDVPELRLIQTERPAPWTLLYVN